MAVKRQRILVAVEPVVLEGALASLLERVDLDDVDSFHAQEHGSQGTYDAAIVTIQLPDGVSTDLVITLPDTVGHRTRGHLTAGERSEEVELPTHREVIDLLDLELPAAASRGSRLRTLIDPG